MTNVTLTEFGNLLVDESIIPIEQAAQFLQENDLLDSENVEVEDLLDGRANVFVLWNGQRRFVGIALTGPEEE